MFGDYKFIPNAKANTVLVRLSFDRLQQCRSYAFPTRVLLRVGETANIRYWITADELDKTVEGKLTVTFTKFMDIATVTEKSLLVANASGYTVTPQLYAEGDLYTDTFIVRGALPAKTKVTVTADCLSYAGTAGESMSMDAGGALALGNVNGDDTINASDASEVLLAAAKLGTGSASGLTPEQEAAADINGDHQINAKDALVILRYAAAVGVGREAVITDFI
jgi:hypothetical protein